MKKKNKNIFLIGFLIIVLLILFQVIPLSVAAPDQFSTPQGYIPNTSILFKPSLQQVPNPTGTQSPYAAYCQFIPMPTTIEPNIRTGIDFSWSGAYRANGIDSLLIKLDDSTVVSTDFRVGYRSDQLDPCIGNSSGLTQLFAGVNLYGLSTSGGSFDSDGYSNTYVTLPANTSSGAHTLSLWKNTQKILEWNINVLGETIIIVPPTPSWTDAFFDFFSSFGQSIIDFLRGIGLPLSIVGSNSGFVNQPYTANISVDSNIPIDLNYSDGSVTYLAAQTVVMNSSGQIVFSSPITSLTSNQYNYVLNWTPTATGNYAIVSTILEKHATFSGGVWSAYSEQRQTGLEKLGVVINSIGSPSIPSFDFASLWQGFVNWVLSIWNSLFR